jgi:hypothetical protein
MSVALSQHGITVHLPTSWEGRIYTRQQPMPAAPAASMAGSVSSAAGSQLGHFGWPGEIPHPIVHVANFALPADRGDFGSGAVHLMGAAHLLLVLFEYGPESVGTALFAHQGLPSPRERDFSPNALQRRIPGQLGYQKFFTHAGRAFCAYVVLGAARNVVPLSTAARTVLTSTQVESR